MDLKALVQKTDALIKLFEKQAFVPSPPPGDPAAGGMPMDPAMAGAMPPPMDPAMMGGMPPPVDPSMGALPPMPPEAMTGAMPPMPPEEGPADPESVTLSMADLKAILAEAGGGANAKGGADAEKKKTTQELLDGIDQKLTSLTEALGVAGGDDAPVEGAPAPEGAMPGQADIAAMLMGGDPAAGGMPPMDPAAAGGMPMDPGMMGGAMPPPPMDPSMGGMPPMDPAAAGGMPPPAVPAGPPPLTDQVLKTASQTTQQKWKAKLEAERGPIMKALRQMSGYTRD